MMIQHAHINDYQAPRILNKQVDQVELVWTP